MKIENIEKMSKAIGMLEALSYVVKSPICDAMDTAVEMLDEVIDDERREVTGDVED